MATSKDIVMRQYNGTDYDSLFPQPSAHATSHAATGTDPITVNAAMIGNDAVTTDKIQDGAVTTGKLGNGAVTSAKIGTGEIATTNVADDAITPAKIDEDNSGTYQFLYEKITGKLFLSGANLYGSSLPASGTVGQIFFKKL